MMSNNKILTVSYGTFSCTLEGFEDSFDTMKLIAEYFRDLAADDRYFGAEPPQPDAETLARIAEREIERRVEAHANEQGIHLRAGAAVASVGLAQGLQAEPAGAPEPHAAQTAEDVAVSVEPDREAELQSTSEVDTANNVSDDMAASVPEDASAEMDVISDVAEETDATDDKASAAEPLPAGEAHIDDIEAAPEDEEAAEAVEDSTTLEVDDLQVDEAVVSEDIEDESDVADAALYEDGSEDEQIENKEIISEATAAEPAPAERAASPDLAADAEDVADGAELTDDTDLGIATVLSEESEGISDADIASENAADDVVAQTPSETPAEAPKESNVMQASLDYGMASMIDTPSKNEVADAAEPEVFQDVAEASAPKVAPNSIAAKLQRIRDVVAKNQASQSGYSEDQHAEEFKKDANASEISSPSDDLDDAIMEQEHPAFSSETRDEFGETSDAFEDESEEALDVASAISALEEDFSAEEKALTETEKPTAETPKNAMRLLPGQMVATDDALPQEALENAEIDEQDDDWEAVLDNVSDALAKDETSVEDHLEDAADSMEETAVPVKSATPSRIVKARVIRVSRSDVDSAIDAGLMDESDADSVESSLSPEEEAELLAELAQVEAELESDTAAAVETTEVTTEASLEDLESEAEDGLSFADDADDLSEAADASGARLLEAAAGAEEEALDRLMAEADQQMEEPEGTSRRDAFNHLRAAVAATKADEKLSSAGQEADDGEYRTDLAAAVKPRRPVAGGRDERPASGRPAPLKLVAEQRIDTPSAKEGPVRPRRVRAEEIEEAPEEAGSFADYVNAQGATQLPEILEAAASYLSFVEGREQFSRPQLMTKVRQIGLDGFTREDGLRHFGKLLRTGKIEKIKGGRFTVSEDIGFRPDDQRAAG